MLKARLNKKNRKKDTHVIKEKNKNIFNMKKLYKTFTIKNNNIFILFSFNIYEDIFLYKLCILGSRIIIHKLIFNIILKTVYSELCPLLQ
jgi:hypothetical protein